MTRLLYLVSHPIQYQAPLLRLIAAQPDLDLRVVFHHDTSDGYFDPDFGRQVRWDLPLRQGYESVLLSQTNLGAEISRADIVWLHGWQGSWMRRALVTAARLGKPVLMRGENTDAAMPDGHGPRAWIKRLYLRWLFNHVTAFLAIGSANRDYYLRRGIAADRIFLVPYAVDNASFAQRAQAADTAALRRDLGIAPGRNIILYAGKMMPRKHPHTLLRAWRDASWNGERPVLLLVGDGELSQTLRDQAAGDGDVIFAGFQNQTALPAFYALADIFVLASDAEPWGLAVNEAMACGTAVVVGRDIGCAHDLVTRQCGATVAAGDAAALGVELAALLPRSTEAGQAAAARMAQWDFAADLAGLRQALAWLETRPCA